MHDVSFLIRPDEPTKQVKAKEAYLLKLRVETIQFGMPNRRKKMV
jgi:hypothetical protein